MQGSEVSQFIKGNHRIFDRYQTGDETNIPGVLSWVQDLHEHRLLLEVSPEMVFFQGHFPDYPVLPGIVQLHWAVQGAMSLFEFVAIPIEVKRLKFKNIVQPPCVLELSLKRKNDNEVQFQFTTVGQVHSMGCLTFKEDVSC